MQLLTQETSQTKILSTREAGRASSGYFFPFLDGLRGIAILSVFITHTVYVNPSNPFTAFLLSLIAGGAMGVPIFFTLSGFLILLAVFSSPIPFDAYAYAWRRTAKIIPSFFLALHWVADLLSFKPLAFFGLVSYEWYPLHEPPVQIVQHYLGHSRGNFLIYSAVILIPSLGSFAVATAMYYLYSAPILTFAKKHLKKTDYEPCTGRKLISGKV